MKENLPPQINMHFGNRKSKAVLITSLNSGYFEKVRDLYWEHPAATGEVIRVYRPNHEGYRQSEKQMHNRMAWADMWLLISTDVLVTNSWSTFAYVAQALGGLKPWILYKPENQTTPDPPCRGAMSMEHCFHAPPFYDRMERKGIESGKLFPHVRHWEDMSWALKLVDHTEL
ncbi:Xyloglucan fucosyltransferase [Dillenia turbinata]|uniref:Fucosyltransferase n=1 Tax=Dillenia turbinata TaxID=194707 RepID=A0AAN8Z2P4_9MAGN